MLTYANAGQVPVQTIKKDDSTANAKLLSSFAILYVYRKSILTSVMAGALLAWGAGKVITPRFNATAQLYLDPKGLHVFENEINSSKNQDSLGGMNVVESQMRVINSLSVLRRVVELEKLVNDEEFVKKGEPGFVGSLMKVISVTPKKAAYDPTPEAIAADELYSRLNVKRAERTYIVEVIMRSKDPEKAARIANSVVQAYLDVQNDNRAENSRKTTGFLTSRLDELREKVRVSEDIAETYKVKNNLLGAKGTLVSEQQLSDANFQLSSAKARVSDAQSRYEQIVKAKKSGDISGVSEAINSQVITSMRAQQSEASRKLSELSLELGVKHPQVQNAKAQMQDMSKMINEELNRIAEAMKNDLERAQSTEAATNSILEKLKTQSATGNQANVQLRELEREVEANRQLYNAFLVRSRETGELEKLDTSNTRVISQATAPFRPTFPPRGLLLAIVGLALGGMLGVGQAFARSFLRRMKHV